MPFFIKSVVLVAVYLVAAKAGLVFGTVHSSATIFWPPGGIALAVLLLGGLRYLPAVFAGAYLAAVMVDAPWVFALGSSLGNTLETFIGYSLLKRFSRIDLALSRVLDLFLVIALGGLIPSIASATLGPFSLMLSGLITAEMLPAIMWRWWSSDVLGIAFFTPLILLFCKNKPRYFDKTRIAELTAMWLVSFFVGQSIFFDWKLPGIQFSQPIGLAWGFPLLIWAGLRSGRRNTGLIQLMFISQALLSAYFHTGYFANDIQLYGLENFWIFAILIAVSGMSLAILASAHRRDIRLNALSAKVFAISNDGIIIVDSYNRIVNVNPAFTALTGFGKDEVIGKDPRVLASGRQDRDFYAGLWQTVLEYGHWKGELWDRRKDGSLYLEKLHIHTLKDAKGRVLNRIGIFSDITLLKLEQESVVHQAQHDYLTNLPNRLLFKDRFNQQLAMANRHKKKFAVIFLDLDGFKHVNDTLGHQTGDKLLVAVAARLTSLVREIDTVCRFGGDEFAILVSEVNEVKDVATLAEKILEVLRIPFQLDAHTVWVSASLGTALYPDQGEDIVTIMGKADAAMYRAKKGGKNSYCQA